jgi:3-hydroxy-D-aspartate aldolase
MNDRELHATLIGQQGGRKAFNTPVLVIDLDVLERNIAAMAVFAKTHGIVLRPHAKTHKSVDIALKQVEAGAAGNCCAKLGEAEALADGGVQSVLITSPVVSPPAIARLMLLNARTADLRVTVDNLDNVKALQAAAAQAGKLLNVLIDIDPGIRRTGVVSPEAAVQVAKAIGASPALHYMGVQYYCGRQQHIESYAERRAEMVDRTDYLKTVIDALAQAGYRPTWITGGGTGTHRIDVELGVLNELQVGSYVFMDRQYNVCDLTGDATPAFGTSLLIDARVVSANTPGLATLDAGLKAMAADGGPPSIASGAPVGTPYHFMGDEHGLIVVEGMDFKVSDRVTLVTPHCDPTVNLYDSFHVVRGDTLVDIWDVQARGRSR